MSGGALDYVCFRLDDPIKEIRDRINKNGKTLQQIWNDKTEEEKKNAVEWGHDWEIPWNEKNVPDNVRLIAEEEAWKKCKGVKVAPGAGVADRSLTSKKARNEWNKIYNDTLKDLIDGHNNGIEHQVYSPETIDEMKRQLETIKRARNYLERIEWLLSDDDGQKEYLDRTKEDLKNVGLN